MPACLLTAFGSSVGRCALQVLAWMTLSRAVFTDSAFYGGTGGSSFAEASTYVVRLALTALASEATNGGALLPSGGAVAVNLADVGTLNRMVAALKVRLGGGWKEQAGVGAHLVCSIGRWSRQRWRSASVVHVERGRRCT